MGPFKDRLSYLIPVLLALWVVAAIPAFMAQYVGLKAALPLSKMSYDEKGPLVSGPVYGLAQRASSVIPDTRSDIHFINPSENSTDGFLSGRLRYYLYPKKIKVSPGASFDISAVKQGDYIIVYAPAASGPEGIDLALNKALMLEPLYREADERGLRAVYRVASLL